MAEDTLSIAEAAQQFTLSEDTLRYYEKIGLASAHRRPSGIRYYDKNDCARLEFVKCMRDAGVSLEALVSYMKMMEKGDKTIEARKKLLIEQREELLKKKALIEHSLERLDHKIDHYEQLMAKGCPNKK